MLCCKHSIFNSTQLAPRDAALQKHNNTEATCAILQVENHGLPHLERVLPRFQYILTSMFSSHPAGLSYLDNSTTVSP